jgi:hypothetical protein
MASDGGRVATIHYVMYDDELIALNDREKETLRAALRTLVLNTAKGSEFGITATHLLHTKFQEEGN